MFGVAGSVRFRGIHVLSGDFDRALRVAGDAIQSQAGGYDPQNMSLVRPAMLGLPLQLARYCKATLIVEQKPPRPKHSRWLGRRSSRP